MNIDKIFLPCAGMGTRMGPLGQIIPKPLWPVVDVSILDINIKVLTDTLERPVVINTHHLSDSFNNYPYRYAVPEILFEKKLLGSGGAFHNLKVNLKEKVIFTGNPDSILILSKRDWNELASFSKKFQNILIALPVSIDSSYNRLIVENSLFKGIEPPNSSTSSITYSGFGLINLESFDFVQGPSSFFDTVINPKINNTGVYIPDSFEYWDFGTIELYKKKIMALLMEESKLNTYLKESIDKSMKKKGGDLESPLLKVSLNEEQEFQIYNCQGKRWHEV